MRISRVRFAYYTVPPALFTPLKRSAGTAGKSRKTRFGAARNKSRDREAPRTPLLIARPRIARPSNARPRETRTAGPGAPWDPSTRRARRPKGEKSLGVRVRNTRNFPEIYNKYIINHEAIFHAAHITRVSVLRTDTLPDSAFFAPSGAQSALCMLQLRGVGYHENRFETGEKGKKFVQSWFRSGYRVSRFYRRLRLFRTMKSRVRSEKKNTTSFILTQSRKATKVYMIYFFQLKLILFTEFFSPSSVLTISVSVFIANVAVFVNPCFERVGPRTSKCA